MRHGLKALTALLFLIAFAPTQKASAVAYELSGLAGCYGSYYQQPSTCSPFYAETGYVGAGGGCGFLGCGEGWLGMYPYTLQFALPSTAASSWSGQAMLVIGDYRQSRDITVSISSSPYPECVGDYIDIVLVPWFSRMTLASCAAGHVLSAYTLAALASAPLDEFHDYNNADPGVFILSGDEWRVGWYGTLRRIPEPSTLALLGLGLAGIGMSRRSTRTGQFVN